MVPLSLLCMPLLFVLLLLVTSVASGHWRNGQLLQIKLHAPLPFPLPACCHRRQKCGILMHPGEYTVCDCCSSCLHGSCRSFVSQTSQIEIVHSLPLVTTVLSSCYDMVSCVVLYIRVDNSYHAVDTLPVLSVAKPEISKFTGKQFYYISVVQFCYVCRLFSEAYASMIEVPVFLSHAWIIQSNSLRRQVLKCQG
jgi:hypothetical protein